MEGKLTIEVEGTGSGMQLTLSAEHIQMSSVDIVQIIKSLMDTLNTGPEVGNMLMLGLMFNKWPPVERTRIDYGAIEKAMGGKQHEKAQGVADT